MDILLTGKLYLLCLSFDCLVPPGLRNLRSRVYFINTFWVPVDFTLGRRRDKGISKQVVLLDKFRRGADYYGHEPWTLHGHDYSALCGPLSSE